MYRIRGIFKGRLSILGEYISPPRVLERMRSDLYIISYPKTGRTWLRMLMKQALHQHLGIPIKDPLEFHELTNYDNRLPRISVAHDDEPHWKKPSELTTNKKRWYRNKKVILVIRDPRDTMVSLYIQMTRRWKVFTPSDKSMNDYIWQERGALKTMIRYYNIWAENKEIPADLLLVKYEDLHERPLQCLRKCIEFLGIYDISDETLMSAIEENKLEKLKKREASGEFTSKRLRPGFKGDPESMKMRKGKIGGYEDYLTPKQGDAVLEYTSQNLDPWYGYRELVVTERKDKFTGS